MLQGWGGVRVYLQMSWDGAEKRGGLQFHFTGYSGAPKGACVRGCGVEVLVDCGVPSLPCDC